MPQYGVLVYMPVPADPAALSDAYLESLGRYPERTQEMKAKVLGGSYFAGQRGFAFESSESGMTIRDDAVHFGPLADSELTPAAFFVLSAPNLDVAVQAAKLHPAAGEGAIEVRPLIPPPAK